MEGTGSQDDLGLPVNLGVAELFPPANTASGLEMVCAGLGALNSLSLDDHSCEQSARYTEVGQVVAS